MRFYFGVGFLIVLAFIAFLVYRGSTANTRLMPKRKLQAQLEATQRELRESDQTIEELHGYAKSALNTEPLLADMIISTVDTHLSNRRKRALVQ